MVFIMFFISAVSSVKAEFPDELNSVVNKELLLEVESLFKKFRLI